MRSDVWGAITGFIGLAALAVSTPASANELETCDGSLSTVLVTVPGVSIVTIHDAPTTTVYVTSPSYAVVEIGELPTTTLTSYYTTTHTTTIYTTLATLENDPTAKIVYETTITETVILNTVYETVSQVNPLSFVVLGGSTSWIGDIAPASTESYVIVTNAITVVPINTPEPSSNMDHTRTTTIITTVVNSHQYTITMTLPPQIITATVLPAGTGIPYTGVAPGGWNASYGFGDGVSVTKPSSSNPVFVTTEPSYDLYSTRIAESLTVSDAKSGFAALSTVGLSSSSTFDKTWTTVVTSTVPKITVLSYSNSTSSAPPSTSSSSSDLITSPTSSTFVSIRYTTMDSVGASSGVSTKSVDGVGTFSSNSFSGYLNSSSTQLTSTTSAYSTTRLYTISLGSYSNDLLTNATHSASLVSIVTATPPAASTSNSFLDVYSTVSSLEGVTTKGGSLSSETFFSSIHKSSVLSSIATTLVHAANSVEASNSADLRVSMLLSSKSSSYTLGYAAGLASSASGPLSGEIIKGTVSVPSSFSTIYTSLPESATSLTVSSSDLNTLESTPFSSAPSDSLLGFSRSSTTISSQTFTILSSPALATPTTCGEVGDFTLNFDDIPPLVATNDTMDTVQPAPLFNPYHQFHFSNGFTVVPPPRDPYFPSSKPLLTEFIPNFTINKTNNDSGPNNQQLGYSGDIGNGDHGLAGCFGFNFYGASFGCDSRGPDCDFTFTGFRYDRATQQTNQVAQEGSVVPACPPLQDCSLVPVIFTNEFMDLDSIRINVTVVGNPKIWWMDDLQLGWFNNTCAAGFCRINAHIH